MLAPEGFSLFKISLAAIEDSPGEPAVEVEFALLVNTSRSDDDVGVPLLGVARSGVADKLEGQPRLLRPIVTVADAARFDSSSRA